MADADYPTIPVIPVTNAVSSVRDTGICEIIKDGIPYLDQCLSYEEFFFRFLLPNKPCVLSPKATQNWQSCKDWVCKDGKPNTEFLHQHFGHAVVPVANCGKQEYGAHPKQEMLLKDYLQYLSSDSAGSKQALQSCLYLKDWHFSRAFPDYTAYETPVYFRSDWLNEFWDTQFDKTDDYKFVYIGPKGSWTPLHADVMRSYSWSANVCGRKKWILFPPGEEEALKDRFGQLVFDVTSSELQDQSVYPNCGKLQHQFEVVQEAGEIIFVPSGWHHQVVNLEDTISINHNWFNGCNIDICWEFIKQSLADVKREIDDCRSMDGWHQQCQLILKSSLGIDFVEFYGLLLSIAQHRLNAIGCVDNSTADQLSLGVKQSCNTATTIYTTDPLLVSRKMTNSDWHKINEPSSDKYNQGDSIPDSSTVFYVDQNSCDCPNTNKTAEPLGLGMESTDLNASIDGMQPNDSMKECLSKQMDGHSVSDIGFQTESPVVSDKSHKVDYCLDLLNALSQAAERKVRLVKKLDTNSQDTDGNSGLLHKSNTNSGLCQEADMKDGLSQDHKDHLNRLQQVHWRFCSKNHALFDLGNVKDIVVKMTQDEDWKQIDLSRLTVAPETLLEEITAVIENNI